MSGNSGRVFIFTEAGKSYGLGHAMRCLSIAQALKAKGITVLFVVNGDKTALGALRGQNCILTDWVKDRRRALGFIRRRDAVIIDSYQAGISFYKASAARAGCCVAVDDNKRLSYPAGAVLNGNVYADKLRYPKAAGVTYLCGSKYTPLRREFWGTETRRINRKLQKILIIMGGADPGGLTGIAAETLSARMPGVKITAVLGPACSKAVSRRGNLKVVHNPDAAKLRRLMHDADAAISAGGQTLYELAHCGTPTLAVAAAENQKNNVRYLKRLGFLVSLKLSGLKKGGGVVEALAKMDFAARSRMSRVGRELVDGKGAARAADFVNNGLVCAGLALRRAKLSDMLDVYKLSAEPEVRRASINSKPIKLAAHKTWFRARLADSATLFLVAEISGKFAGQARFSVEGDTAVASISLCSEYRGMGLSGRVLSQSLKKLKSVYPGVKSALAYIKPENTASCRLFSKAGFKYSGRKILNGARLLQYVYGY